MIKLISKKLMMALLAGLFLAGCATSGFSRFTGRALQLDLPVYSGTPPAEYSYRSLGPVEGKYEETSVLFGKHATATIFSALEDMVKNAKAMGANAVIKTETGKTSSINLYVCKGEAVIFDVLPE